MAGDLKDPNCWPPARDVIGYIAPEAIPQHVVCDEEDDGAHEGVRLGLCLLGAFRDEDRVARLFQYSLDHSADRLLVFGYQDGCHDWIVTRRGVTGCAVSGRVPAIGSVCTSR